jgi:hypothetical protein
MSRSTRARAVLAALVFGFLMWQPTMTCAQQSAWPIASAAPAAATDEPIALGASTYQVAQGQPMHYVPPKHLPLWRLGLDYTVDVSMAWPFGNTGKPTGVGLPGGMDVIGRYAFSPDTRFVFGYYDLQEYPVGFDTGIVPVYLQGTATPISAANLASKPDNVVIKNSIVNMHLDQVVWTKLMGEDFPITFSPDYTQRWGSIGGGSDLLPVEENGLPYLLHYRLGSFYSFGMTIPVPFLTQPKRGLITTYTIAPQWTAGVVGANAGNSAQLVQILHTIYHPTKDIQIDLAPSLYPNYLPTDIWPQHYLTMIYSVAYTLGHDKTDPWGRPLTNKIIPFVQATASMGGAMNVSPYGIKALYCQSLPCTSPTELVPALGGNHAAQFQLKVGIGHPDIIPL